MSDGKIYGALARVMAEVGSVGKAKKNSQQGYQFRGIDDVVAHVQDVMARNGVVCVPRVVARERETVATKSGGSMASVRLLVDHHFFADDGSAVVCTTLGEAMDSGDKASNKAMSAALKYALTETLLIPTYEVDRDTEESSPQMGPPQTPSSPPSSNVVPMTSGVSLVAKWTPRIGVARSLQELMAVGLELAKELDSMRVSPNDRKPLREIFDAKHKRLAAAETASEAHPQ